MPVATAERFTEMLDAPAGWPPSHEKWRGERVLEVELPFGSAGHRL